VEGHKTYLCERCFAKTQMSYSWKQCLRPTARTETERDRGFSSSSVEGHENLPVPKVF